MAWLDGRGDDVDPDRLTVAVERGAEQADDPAENYYERRAEG